MGHMIDADYSIQNFLLTIESADWPRSDENVKYVIFNAIKEFFQYSKNEFNLRLQNERFAYVTDIGSNKLSALKKFKRVSYAAHNLNLVIEYSFKKIDVNGLIYSLLNSCKDLVQYVKRTGNNVKLSLKTSVPTRWNSILTCC